MLNSFTYKKKTKKIYKNKTLENVLGMGQCVHGASVSYTHLYWGTPHMWVCLHSTCACTMSRCGKVKIIELCPGTLWVKWGLTVFFTHRKKNKKEQLLLNAGFFFYFSIYWKYSGRVAAVIANFLMQVFLTEKSGDLC